jgi:hypothetical protein
MITAIRNVQPTGAGILSFDLTAGFTGANEPIVLMLDGKRIAFRLTIEPDEVRRVTVRHDEPNLKRVTVSAPESGIEATPPPFDSEAYGMQFQAPRPRDIVLCDSCGSWHQMDEPC